MTNSLLDVRRGSRAPRVSSFPPARSSAGQEAIDLAESAGLHLDPWQQDVLIAALGEGPGGQWVTPDVGLVVPRQNGKGPHALPTPILTTDGWTTIGDIRAGQYVYGPDGQPTRVVATSEVFEGRNCFEVAFTDGANYIVAAEHLWPVFDKDCQRWVDAATDHLAGRFGRARRDNGRREFRYRIRCDAELATPKADLPIDPYLLGYWLGDGTHTAASITCGHGDLAWVCGRLERSGAIVNGVVEKDHGKSLAISFRTTTKWSKSGFLRALRGLGIHGNKRVPEIYLTASPEQRRELLAGLLDSDGTVSVTGRSPQVEFTTCIPELATDVLRLARSLGIRTSIHRGSTPKRDRYRIQWTPTFNPFQMPRKAERYWPPMSRRQELMSIVDIQPVSSVPTRCIQVERDDGIYLVGHLFTPTHNSILEARELAGLFLFGESILHTSHEFKTSMDHFRRLERLIKNTPDLDRQVEAYPRAPGTEGIVLRDGRALRFMARTKGAGRGFPADMVVLDEAFALNDEHSAALLPTTQSKPNPQFWYTSSPPLDGVSGEPLFALRARGEAGADDLCWLDWGAVLGVDPDDREAWWATNPAMGYRLSERSMAGMRAKMKADDFTRECLGVWPRNSAEMWLVIPRTDWFAAADPESPRPSPIAFAVTLSTDRRWATIAAAGPRPDGLQLVHIVDRREGTGWVIERLLELIARWKPVAVVIDKGSPAKSIADDAEAAGITLTPIQTRDVAGAAGALYDGIAGRPARDPETGEFGRDPRIVRHRDQPELNAAVAAAVKRNLAAMWAFDQMAAAVDITPLIACANALWGYTTREVVPEQPFFFARR